MSGNQTDEAVSRLLQSFTIHCHGANLNAHQLQLPRLGVLQQVVEDGPHRLALSWGRRSGITAEEVGPPPSPRDTMAPAQRWGRPALWKAWANACSSHLWEGRGKGGRGEVHLINRQEPPVLGRRSFHRCRPGIGIPQRCQTAVNIW